MYSEVGLLIKCESDGYELALVVAVAVIIVGYNNACVANLYLGPITFGNGIDAE